MAAERVAKTVSNLKEFARQSKITDKMPMFVNEAVENAVRLAQTTLRKSGVDLKIVLGDNIPMIEGNLHGIEQIVLNLLINSLQAMDHKQGKVEVGTGYNEKDSQISVTVSDNGRGVDPAM